MKKQLKKLLCSVLMVCMMLSLFTPVQVQAGKKGKCDGSREHPYSAYNAKKVKIYSGEHYLGKFKIKLLNYKDGEEAKDFIQEDDEYDDIKKSDECVYMKFRISYLSGENEINLVSVVYIDGDIYNKKSNKHLWTNTLYGYKSDIDWLSATSLYPGGTVKCYEAFTIPKGNTPITYRVQTGYNRKTDERIYTWFTTKK